MTEKPQPMTTSECDLRDFPFMPLEVAQLLDSETWLTATGDEAKAAVTLWCKSWHQVPAASLPNNDRILALLSGAGAKWKKVKEVAMRGFVLCADGRLYHHVIAEKAMDSWARKIAQRDRTRAATDARNAKRNVNVTETKGQGQREGQGQKELEPVTQSGSSGSEPSGFLEPATATQPPVAVPRPRPPPCSDVPSEPGVEPGFERALLEQMQPKLPDRSRH